MGLLDRLFGGRGVPEWAAFLTPEEFETFAGLLSQALRARSLPAEVRAGKVTAGVGGERATVGFHDLARKCKGVDSADWPALIAQHLDVALRSDQSEIARLGENFEEARSCMKVQLMSDSAVRRDWEEGLNYRTFGNGVKAALAYDLPELVCSVPASHVRSWGRSFSDLFEEAAELVRREPELPVLETIEMPDVGLSLHQLVGDGYFVCSHALWLERHGEAQSERGVLVAVPSRNIVVFHAIRDASAWRALSTLPGVAHTLYSNAPGPVSPNLFWLRQGQVVDVPTTATPAGMQVMPPAQLLAAMPLRVEP